MTFLVDANVLSEATKPLPNAQVLQWLRDHEGDIVIDSVVLGKLAVGIRLVSAGRKRTQLEAWFENLVQTVECLPWDAAVSLRWARLVADLRKKGTILPILDGMIAASALYHGLTIATRNARDFRLAGVPVVEPGDQHQGWNDDEAAPDAEQARQDTCQEPRRRDDDAAPGREDHAPTRGEGTP